MPVYEYRCEQGHRFEVTQRMADDALTSCSTCDAPVQRVFHPVAVHFKGSGFYTTDYGKKKSGDTAPKDDKKPAESPKPEKKSSEPSSAKSSD